jgi:Protein of unknown function (DUF4058)
MPVHDWSKLEAGLFHDFHNVWVAELRTALNSGLLQPDYYALIEQHARRQIPDLLTLHMGAAQKEVPTTTGGVAVLEAPPRTRRKVVDTAARTRRKTVVVRHVSGHRMIAIIEIVSPANKDRELHVDQFAAKIETALQHGIHVLLIDVFKPGKHDPHGMHGTVWNRVADEDESDCPPADEPFTLASYVASEPIEAYLEHVAIGMAIPDMPLFLDPDRYINVPLEQTYLAAYRGFPAFWRGVLEQPS